MPDFKRSKKPIVDAVFEGVGIDWLTKIGVGVGVVGAFGGAVSPSCTAGEKYSKIPRQVLSSLAPPR